MSGIYNITRGLLAQGTLGWSLPASVFKAILVGTSYSFNTGHRYVSDVLAHEVTSPTYARQVLEGRRGFYDDPFSRGVLDADPTSWVGLDGVTPAGVVIYKQVGLNDNTPADDPLVAFYNFTPVAANASETFQVEYHSTGLIHLTD